MHCGMRLALFALGCALAEEDCHRPVKLWIHQDGTASFASEFAIATKYIPQLLTALNDELQADGFDYGLSVFLDRDSTDCYRHVVGFGGDMASKIVDTADQMAHMTVGGGGNIAEDTFSGIPVIAKQEFQASAAPGEVRLFLIITDDVGKYHNMLNEIGAWGIDTYQYTFKNGLQFEGINELPSPEDRVQCSSSYRFLTHDQICQPIVDNKITPIFMISKNFRGSTSPHIFYRGLFKDYCGLNEDANEMFVTFFDQLSEAQDIIMQAVGTAKCIAPTAEPTTTSGGDTTTSSGDTTTSSGDTTTTTTRSGSETTEGGKHKKPIGPIAGAAAGAVALLAAAGILARRRKPPTIDVDEEAQEVEQHDQGDREAQAHIDEGQFAA